jgi:hypothetical protein
MRDTEIERTMNHGARIFKNIDAAEVVPQAKRDRRQLQPATAAAVVAHGLVAIRGRQVGHFRLRLGKISQRIEITQK